VKDLRRGFVNKCEEPVGKRGQLVQGFAKENCVVPLIV
jgi:hypothetical protein